MKWFSSYSRKGRGDEAQNRKLETPHVVSCWIWVLFAILVCAGNLFAADVAADFSAANELYAKGKYAGAAAAYEKIIQTSGQSAALLFNCGNAEFKAGHLGKAIVAYRRAELLAPRDAELRASLAFVRTQVQGTVFHESRWQSLAGSLTLNEGTVLTALFLWVLFALLIARQVQPALAPKLRTMTRVAVVLTVFSGAVLGVQAANHFHSTVAVVTGAEATARSGPFDDAQSAFTAHDGVELQVLDRHDAWVEVGDGSGKVGWFNDKQVEVLPGV